MKKYIIISFLIFGSICKAQNMVPNPSFENNISCMFSTPQLDCLELWKDHSAPANPILNTADLCFNGAVFFPPSSIPAYDGSQYIGIDCQLINPEYVQVRMSSAMTAGTSYCVSFYVSVCDQTTQLAPSLGAYFSVSELTVNPHVVGLTAHVQGTVPADPFTWTKISGNYVATGGEEFITLGGFQNNATTFSYMYIDLVEVYPITPLELGIDQFICSGDQIILDGGSGGTGYLWSTGETTSSISITIPGTYWLEKFTGSCSMVDSIVVLPGICNDPPALPVDSIIEGALFIPNSFTPNNDGLNDLFAAKGEYISNFEMAVYDRWGERIFKSESINDAWDGTFKSHPASQDVYSYTLTYQNGRDIKHCVGHVTLIR